MTEGERVREIRKFYGLTSETFGSRLGVGKAAISKIENGKCGLTEQAKKTICREFNVNYDWLKDETGEMFSNLPNSILGDLCQAYGCDEFDRAFIESYLESDPDMRATIKKFIQGLLQKNNAGL